MNGVAETKRVGWLDGFFECSMANIEDLYPVTYLQGDSITVHMEDRDVTFVHREKMYVANFTDWIVVDEARLQEIYQGLSLMTASDRESMYTRKEVCKALEAGEFLKSLRYPTEREAISIVRDGNVLNIPYRVDVVRRF